MCIKSGGDGLIMESLWIMLLAIGVLLFIVSLFMMLYWRVFSIIDEISGRKAKRQIAKLRKYNSTEGDMSSVSTGELELLTTGGGSMLTETVTKVSTGSASLRDRIDDPYRHVGKGAIKQSPEEKPSVYVLDDCVTGILSEVELGMLSKKSIIILDEQSSL